MKTTSSQSAIAAVGLRKSFGDKLVLDGIDLTVPAGTVFALLGPNGAGKTTTVQILSTLISPDGGEIRVDGHDLAREPDAVRAAIGVTGQFSAVDNLLTGEENLRLMADLHHLDRDGPGRRPTHRLPGRADHRTMWQIIRDLVAGGVTIFLTTQYLEEADELADRIALLDHGKLVAEGTADELKRRIPGGHISLQFADADGLESAARTLGQVLRDDEALTLQVPSDGGVRSLRALLDRLDDESIEVDGLSIHAPDLDDVFLALTGQPDKEKEPAR